MSKQKESISTQERIKEAARKLFSKKGYAATKTRDIANESGINLALLNYHFGSKEKLFHLIMEETLQEFFPMLGEILNNDGTSFEEKVEGLVESYIEMLKSNPEMPLFVLSELRNDQHSFVTKFNPRELLMNSNFVQQYQQKMSEPGIEPLHPMHFIMNLMGMVVFPFIASPILKNIGGLKQDDFYELMDERKKLVPQWINKILNVN